MRILFYKGPSKFYGRFIRFWTGSAYTHCELLFDDGIRFAVDLDNTPVAGYTGTPGGRWNEFTWDCLTVPGPVDEAAIRAFCAGTVGAEYDWLGIAFAMVLGTSRQSGDKWFCSEHVASALRAGGFPLKKPPYTYSPARLFAELRAAGATMLHPA
jgi:hypothetical protein